MKKLILFILALVGLNVANAAYDPAKNTFTTNVLVNGGNITISNNHPKITLVETNASEINGALSQTGIELYRPGDINGAIFKLVGSTNAVVTGSLPGDLAIRGEPTRRIIIANGTAMIAYFDNVPVVKSLVFTNGTTLFVPNLITSGTNNSTFYQVGGVTGFNGVVTNDIGTVTNIMFYGSGILTNLVRIGP